MRDVIERSDHPRRTAILGSSRILFGLSLDRFAARFPGVPVAQLAIPATGPLAALKSFAYDSDFDGVVLFSFNPENLMPPREDEQAAYANYYHKRWSPDQKLNFALGNMLEPNLVSRYDYYGLNRVLRSLLDEASLPESPLYLSVRRNRQHDADFTLTDPETLRSNRVEELLERYDELARIVDRQWPKTLETVVAAVNEIHSRGGCVVFVRLPIAGVWLEQDRRVFPAPKYWDDVLSKVGAFGVRSEQLKGADDILLPDHEHLDARDQARFTDALLDELEAMGIYNTSRSCRP